MQPTRNNERHSEEPSMICDHIFVDIIDDSGKNISICKYRPPRNNNNHVSIDLFLLEFSQ